MDKQKKLVKETVLFSMEHIKDCIENTGIPEELLKYSQCIKTLSEAYKNVK